MPMPSGLNGDREEPERSFGEVPHPLPDATPKPGKQAVPVPVRCGACQSVGFAYFPEGWNLAKADRLMNRRPVRGNCGGCGKTGVELIPIPHLTESDKKELYHLFRIQETLDEANRRGWQVGRRSLILPIEKIDDMAKKAAAGPRIVPDTEEG